MYMKQLSRIYPALLFFFLFPLFLSAEEEKKAIPFDAIQNELVMCVNSDSNGMIWIGSTKGLFHYDGNTLYKYMNLDISNTYLNTGISRIIVDEDGTVIACGRNGISLYQPDTDNFLGIANNVPNSNIVDRLPNGNYLAYDLYKKAVLTLNPDLTRVVGSATLELISSNCKFLELSNGNYCIYTARGFAIFTPDLDPVYVSDLKNTVIHGVCEYQGQLFLGITGSERKVVAYSLDGYAMAGNAGLSQYTDGREVHLLAAADRNLYLGIKDDGIFRYDDSTEKLFPVSISLGKEIIDNDISLMHLDSEQQLWVKSNVGDNILGLNVLRTQSTYPELELVLSTDDSVVSRNIRSIAYGPDGDLYILFSSGVEKYTGEDTLPVIDLPAPNCRDIAFDSYGNMWLLSLDSIFAYEFVDGRPVLKPPC